MRLAKGAAFAAATTMCLLVMSCGKAKEEKAEEVPAVSAEQQEELSRLRTEIATKKSLNLPSEAELKAEIAKVEAELAEVSGKVTALEAELAESKSELRNVSR